MVYGATPRTPPTRPREGASLPWEEEEEEARLPVPLTRTTTGAATTTRPTSSRPSFLTAGRLAAALAGDAELLAVVVPLLAESGVGGASAPSKATAMHVVASLAALAGCGGHLWAYDAQIDAMVKAYKSSSEGAAGALLFGNGGGGGRW